MPHLYIRYDREKLKIAPRDVMIELRKGTPSIELNPSSGRVPGTPANVPELMAQMNATRRNNRLYVRLLTATPGAVVGGHTLPALPSSVRSVLDADKSVASAALSRSIVGAWEQRLDRVVKGSREITVTLGSSK